MVLAQVAVSHESSFFVPRAEQVYGVPRILVAEVWRGGAGGESLVPQSEGHEWAGEVLPQPRGWGGC